MRYAAGLSCRMSGLTREIRRGRCPDFPAAAQAGKKLNQTRSVPKSFEEGAGLCVFIGRIFMSAVTLLCADRPLPLYDSGIRQV